MTKSGACQKKKRRRSITLLAIFASPKSIYYLECLHQSTRFRHWLWSSRQKKNIVYIFIFHSSASQLVVALARWSSNVVAVTATLRSDKSSGCVLWWILSLNEYFINTYRIQMPEYDFRQARCDTHSYTLHSQQKWMETKIVMLTTNFRLFAVVVEWFFGRFLSNNSWTMPTVIFSIKI